MGLKSHMADVLRLDRQTELRWLEIVVSSGLIVLPIGLGLLAGRLGMGLAVATGALLAGNVTLHGSARARAEEIVLMTLSLFLACLVGGCLAGGGGWADMGLWGATTLAALIGNFDRIAAIVTGRFIVFVVILTEMARQAHHPHALVVPVMTGGILAACLISALAKGVSASAPPAPGIGVGAKARRWVRSCRSLPACQFPLRLAVLMALTLSMDALWPERHVLWAALTVALLCRRQLERVPIRASQRALGASLGVLLSCLFLVHAPSRGEFILFLAGLGIASMVARKHNYMLYSMVATPLIMVLVGGGKTIGEAILVDRLVWTIAGAALLLAVNIVVVKMIRYCERRDIRPLCG
ncbi:FUSC family protein [Gluconacetobacter sp. Hr-1-5]|uniref:FUSC family protein n=1 Tax=Gluconacetobacter sp. Hr-1-5 TaxID=3395370 RepID=UPI003B51A5FD